MMMMMEKTHRVCERERERERERDSQRASMTVGQYLMYLDVLRVGNLAFGSER
jgi:hypothetical protein